MTANIPSEEDFTRAEARMRDRDRNLGRVNESVFSYFKVLCPADYHNAYVIAEGTHKFRAYIFYKRNADIQIYADNGVAKKIEDFIYEALEQAGRGTKAQIALALEFDSDENVTANCDGDYLLRLR